MARYGNIGSKAGGFMSFGGLIQTFQGRNELAKAELGEPFQFTEIWLGDGSFSGSFMTKERLEHAVMQLPISSMKQKEEKVILESDFHSQSAPQAFYFREIGIFANGKLCFYDNAGTDAEYIDPEASQIVKQKRLRFVLSISSNIEVTVNLEEGLYALEEELVEHTENDSVHITEEERENWNEEIGEKVAAFSQTTNRVNIVSGEKLKVSLGKIKKYFSDLKTVAFSGSYNDLSNKPTIPAAVAVKGNAESAYRTGNVNLTAENIGALPVSGGTLTGDLRIKGNGNYGTKINLGDGDYVHFYEPTDDCLEVKAKKINFLVSDTTDAKFTLNGEKIGAKADKLTTARNIDGIAFDGSANISHYAVCSSQSNAVEKDISIPNFNLTVGARITVNFLHENVTERPVLRVNGSNGHKADIVYRHSENGFETISNIGCGTYDFVYNGTFWEMVQGAVAADIKEGSDFNAIAEVYSGFKYIGGVIKNYPFLKLSFLSITFQATVETATGNNISVCRMQKSPSVNTALSARVSRNIGAINAVIFTGGNLSIATDRAIPAEGYILCSGIYSFA